MIIRSMYPDPQRPDALTARKSGCWSRIGAAVYWMHPRTTPAVLPVSSLMQVKDCLLIRTVRPVSSTMSIFFPSRPVACRAVVCCCDCMIPNLFGFVNSKHQSLLIYFLAVSRVRLVLLFRTHTRPGRWTPAGDLGRYKVRG